jgi:hypothetical protein
MELSDILDPETQTITIRDLDALHYIWEQGIQLKPYSAVGFPRAAVLAALERKQRALHEQIEHEDEETHEQATI